jgi:hypothetical protein
MDQQADRALPPDSFGAVLGRLLLGCVHVPTRASLYMDPIPADEVIGVSQPVGMLGW